ncbi:hypothetical protein JQ596_22055 [Bradyrhizobium manausense]|uniref:hypothetical protein n=1 Tax=Bradyrhizobium TaxID=374 RepID=UPI001BAA5790|nr:MULTISPECIES: hypothetical protein [Bradyrhizobium]MBR0828224.1 hypothetical protein [Bradyrhizobium manausense]UVO25696.1 hypothetical protein KUF59_24245 [Bradyrhizobium arachidis]
MTAQDDWSEAGVNILAPELLTKVRNMLEREPIILEHRLYAGSAAPLMLIFDDYDEFVRHLESRAGPGDRLLMWGYSGLCRDDNIAVDAKYPDAAGRTPRGGSY